VSQYFFALIGMSTKT